MEKNETTLTTEVYENIVNNLASDIVKLKKDQGESLTRISREKEILSSLKEELKKIKKDIRVSKRNLRTEKNNLIKVDSSLYTRKSAMSEINLKITSKKEKTINLNDFAFNTKKR